MWTGLRSSDDEVSKCITFCKESIFLQDQYFLSLTFARVHAYIACVERLYNRSSGYGIHNCCGSYDI